MKRILALLFISSLSFAQTSLNRKSPPPVIENSHDTVCEKELFVCESQNQTYVANLSSAQADNIALKNKIDEQNKIIDKLKRQLEDISRK
mgnify:CR=1 FL=1